MMLKVPGRAGRRQQVAIFIAGLCASALPGWAQGSAVPIAPPPAPPIHQATAQDPRAFDAGPQPGPGPVLYSIGQPTDEEQLYLEYINRSRANPTAEGVRLAATTDPDVLAAYSQFGVDLNLMKYEFSTNPAVPPLAMNAQMLAAARWHSGDMFTNQYQGHYETFGSPTYSPGDRLTANGYNWYTWGENVYSYAYSVFHGHAGFNVDWGYGVGGMQDPAGHRANIHHPGFREIGIGVVDGMNGSNPSINPVGPQLVTQDFGTRQSATPLISGVLYYDLNGNGFYDVGEGIGGVNVSVPGSSYYALTADSGGYTVPVTTNGSYAVVFTAPWLTNQSVAVVTSGKNVKVDYIPVYAPPVISGPNPASLNQPNVYSFTPVGAATGYDWLQTQLASYTAVEGAESGLANVTVVSSAGYSVLASDVKASGSYSFHLCQPDATDQFVTLNAMLRVTSSSQLSFAKRLGWADDGQTARAQISTDSGTTWQDLWSQVGSGGSGDSGFSTVTVPLGSYAGQFVKIRFAYTYTLGGYYYPQTSTGVGFYFDNIAISNADQAQSQVTNSIPSGLSFTWTPTNTGSMLLQVRARINSRRLPWGPITSVNIVAAPPSIQLAKPVVAGSQVQFDFDVANYRSGMTFELWTNGSPAGVFAKDTTATFQTVIANSRFRATSSTAGAARKCYRVKALY